MRFPLRVKLLLSQSVFALLVWRWERCCDLRPSFKRFGDSVSFYADGVYRVGRVKTLGACVDDGPREYC